MLRCCALLGAVLAPLVLAGVARADARTYLGPHPLDLDGHWHFDEGLHTHEVLPVGTGPFADVGGALVFLADPLAWGYDGDVWSYRGAHPIPGGVDAYCGIAGVHRHEFAPEGSYRRDASGEYVYAGALRGGMPMVQPGRAAPARSSAVVASAPAVVPVVPYWYGAVPRYAAAPVPQPPAPQPAPPSAAPSAFAGRYTRTESRPSVAGRRVERAVQARRDR